MGMATEENSIVAGSKMESDPHRCVNDTAAASAALSLCALGRRPTNIETPTQDHGPSSNDMPATNLLARTAVVSHVLVHHLPSRCATMPSEMPSQPHRHTVGAGRAVAHVTARKNSMKPKDPKRDTGVPFEEMKRLMRVYGPIKSLRNRSSKETGRAAQPASIKRKFYRWFPDFHERFVNTEEGWFMPKAGHHQEMQYRESMRTIDQKILVKKRNDKRYGCRMIGQPMIGQP